MKLAGTTLLLLEDEPLLRRRLAAQLEKLGVIVTVAGTIAEARRAAGQASFDFALLDVNLPLQRFHPQPLSLMPCGQPPVTSQLTGIYAPGVTFTGPVRVGDIAASDAAAPVLVLGAASDTLVTGGDLFQPNNRPVVVAGIAQLKFVDGSTSHGVLLPAQSNRAQLEQDNVNVTAQVVLNPSP
jgi:CheY-like chemotaxis protein